MSPQERRGELVFMEYCHQCHPDGDTGIGPTLLMKVPLDKTVTRTQVRAGFGAMPAYPKETISDEDLEAVIVYIDLLRRVSKSE